MTGDTVNPYSQILERTTQLIREATVLADKSAKLERKHKGDELTVETRNIKSLRDNIRNVEERLQEIRNELDDAEETN